MVVGLQLAITGKVGVASGKSADVAYFCWNKLEMQPADGASVGRKGVAGLRRRIQRGKASVKGHAPRLQSVIVMELALRASAVHGHALGPRFPFGTTRLGAPLTFDHLHLPGADAFRGSVLFHSIFPGFGSRL